MPPSPEGKAGGRPLRRFAPAPLGGEPRLPRWGRDPASAFSREASVRSAEGAAFRLLLFNHYKEVIDIGHLLEAFRRRLRARALYRIYVTDALYALCQFAGIALKGRYIDALRAPGAEGMALAQDRLRDMGIEVMK